MKLLTSSMAPPICVTSRSKCFWPPSLRKIRKVASFCAIQSQSGDVLQVDTGSLYPALHRLERQKWIRAEWRLSENNQRVKLYQLTKAGKKQLASERSRWKQLQEAIGGILDPGAMESET